jgi:hypothetical protein
VSITLHYAPHRRHARIVSAPSLISPANLRVDHD